MRPPPATAWTPRFEGNRKHLSPTRLPSVRHHNQLLTPVHPGPISVHLERQETLGHQLVQPSNVDTQQVRSTLARDSIGLRIVPLTTMVVNLQRQRLYVGEGEGAVWLTGG